MRTRAVSRCATLQWLYLVVAAAAASPSPVTTSSVETTFLTETVYTTLVPSTDPVDPPCLTSLSVELAPGTEQLADGSVRAPQSTTLPKGGVFPDGTYWLPAPDKPLRGCVCMAGPPCLMKCCPWDQYMHNRKCVAVNESTPPFDVDTSEPHRRWLLGSGVPRDPNKRFFRLEVHRFPADTFTLLDNASLYVPGHTQSLLRPGEFCLEVFSDIGKVSALVGFRIQQDAPVVQKVEEIYYIGESLSLLFLLATLLVYIILPELRNLHGKTFMSYIGSMAAAYFDLICTQLDFFPSEVCPYLGFFLQFSFLACFFWLNVMCYDIWSTFRGSKPTKGSTCRKGRDMTKFIWYSAYAWGSSLVILTITLALYFVPNLPEGFLRPEIGEHKCFFETFESHLAFFLGPISVLVTANVALFAHTAWRLAQLKRETAALKTADSHRHSEAERQRQAYATFTATGYNRCRLVRLILYLKLFLIMGLNWVAEIVSMYFPSLSYVWIVTDVCNTLQGIFIFVMFVCKKRVWRLLKARFNKNMPNPRSSGNNSTAMTDATINGSVHSSNSKRLSKITPSRKSSAS